MVLFKVKRKNYEWNRMRNLPKGWSRSAAMQILSQAKREMSIQAICSVKALSAEAMESADTILSGETKTNFSEPKKATRNTAFS
jgi:hypothetical protein